MPFAKREDRVVWERQYYKKNAEQIKAREKAKYELCRSEIRERRKKLYKDNLIRNRRLQREFYARLRSGIISAYGSKCACCGEIEPLFLEIDHINENGHAHRKKIGHSSQQLYQWLKRNNYPKDNFQLLCANCNQGKKRTGGICPHKLRSNQ